MGRSSSTMERFAPVCQRLRTSGSNKGGQDASISPANSLRSSVRASAISFVATTIAQPLIFYFYWKSFRFLLTFATAYFSVHSAQTTFSYPGTYNCCSNCICLGTAHVFNGAGDDQALGSLSLLPEVTFQTRDYALNRAGVVYSNVPVKLLDLSTNSSLSFNTYFAEETTKGIDQDNATSEVADGMTFVISADNSSAGFNGSAFGIFNRLSVGLGVPVLLVVCITFFFVLRMYGSKGGDGDLQRGWFSFKKYPVIEIMGPKRFKYRDLSVACKNFGEESELGKGGFGTVYSGVLPSRLHGFYNTKVAMKKIHADSRQGVKEFMAEVYIITQLRHRNLIRLLGWCDDASKKQYLLVYELMPNGSLDKVLFGPAGERAGEQTASLSWEKRFNIVTGTAAALAYLHEGWEKQVIHGDIKSSNIMLDEEWDAKLGDFGLARLVDRKREPNTTDTVGGTLGYLAPELALSRKFSDKSDVFAFGAVVLEVACGRPALSPPLPPDEKELVKWVWNRLSKGDLMKTVDRRLEEYDANKMEVMLKIGLLCSHPYAASRPSMQYVGQVLSGVVPAPSVPLFMPALVLGSILPSRRILSNSSNDLEVEGTLGLEPTPSSLVSNYTSHSSHESTTTYFSMI